MKIVPMVPFRTDRNLGAACNEAMAMLADDQWAALIDHDCMFTTPHWYEQLLEVAAFQPDATFAVVTNRIASGWQRAPEAQPDSNDIGHHRHIGEVRRREHRTLLDIGCTKGFGGVVTLVSKRAWQDAGGYADGLYCADHSLFFRLRARGRPVYLIEGLYVFHLRASSSQRPPLPAPKWADCPCRGPEEWPTRRIALP